jgi:peptidoglycan/xylan/chitin deacetylase (PgdA/CDA1 family)
MVMTSGKSLLGRLIFASGLNAGLLRNSAVVVTFHRIQDTERPEALTVSIATFERYCRFFQRYFHVVSLRDLVARLEQGVTPNGELAITFDDGYRDNYENAAPVLERLSLPATFFIVTRWMDTQVVPWWDEELGIRHPWMTWDQVRSLHRRGFEIGAHTQTHVDLGSITTAEARREVQGARHDLERRLGAAVTSFAYPYGRRENLTDANREVVRAAGFRCCCSGYGGTNPHGTDPFRLQRVPISGFDLWPHQFGFDVALGRTLLDAGEPVTARPRCCVTSEVTGSS